MKRDDKILDTLLLIPEIQIHTAAREKTTQARAGKSTHIDNKDNT